MQSRNRKVTLVPASCTALDISSAVASPFLGFLALMGNKIILDLNSFNLCVFSCRDYTLLFLRFTYFQLLLTAIEILV